MCTRLILQFYCCKVFFEKILLLIHLDGKRKGLLLSGRRKGVRSFIIRSRVMSGAGILSWNQAAMFINQLTNRPSTTLASLKPQNATYSIALQAYKTLALASNCLINALLSSKLLKPVLQVANTATLPLTTTTQQAS